jgi:hypothetical protein
MEETVQELNDHSPDIPYSIPFSDENGMRDFLFRNYKETFAELIKGKKPEPVWKKSAGFPSIRYLIQHDTERRINRALNDLKSHILGGKEVRLEKAADTTTRIDLLGCSIEGVGLTIIELKKSKQTERQAFTELLAYANHFSTLFPGLGEDSIVSVLVAPMENRIVRDAYFQELVVNKKNVIALIPQMSDDDFWLEVYYPNEQYYKWIENKILDDRTFFAVVASFPEIEGWIDTDRKDKGWPPDHSVEALNTMALLIAQKLEASRLHGMVYARQYWSELVDIFPNPNSIIVSVLNPFSSFQDSWDGVVFNDIPEVRVSEIQAIVDQLVEDSEYWPKNLWIARMADCFGSNIIGMVQESFNISFREKLRPAIQPEISCPDWGAFKLNMVEAATCHNLDLFTTGLLREIYHEYIKFIYENGYDKIYYADDLPKFSYSTLNNFLAVWEILQGLSLREEEE